MDTNDFINWENEDYAVEKKNRRVVFSRIFIPCNLDLSLFDDMRIEYKMKCLKIISTVHWRSSVIYKNIRCKKCDIGFVPMARKSQDLIIGENFITRVRDDLVRFGIIETKEITPGKIGSKIISYRFTKKYFGQKVKNILSEKETKYIVESKESSIKIIMAKKELSPNHKYLLECLDNVEIDYPTASSYLEEIYDKDLRELNHAYNCAKISIDSIKDKNWFFTVSPVVNRVFTNVSNLKSELRRYLTYQGKKLVEIDITNSQPLLLYTLYKDKTSNEAMAYKDLVESGRFNEGISALCGLTFSNASDRKAFKTQLFRELFDNEKHSGKYTKLFYDTFPILAAEIKEIKRVDYRKMSHYLQNLESDLIINNVVTICRELKIPALTIHDSILTLSEYKEDVSNIIVEQCQLMYDVSPKLK